MVGCTNVFIATPALSAWEDNFLVAAFNFSFAWALESFCEDRAAIQTASVRVPIACAVTLEAVSAVVTSTSHKSAFSLKICKSCVCVAEWGC